MKLSIVLSTLATVAVAACSNTVSLSYQPTSTVPPANANPKVAVGSFVDQRKDSSLWIGTIRGGYGNPLKYLYASEPVNEMIRKEFVAGLASRGLLAEEGNAPYELTGVIKQFDCNEYARRDAHADFVLRLTDNATHKVVLIEPVKRDFQGGFTLEAGIFGGVDDLRDVAQQTLQQAVDAGLDSPEFKAVIAAGAPKIAGANH